MDQLWVSAFVILDNRTAYHERLQIVDLALVIEENRQESNWMPTLTIHKIHRVHGSLLLHQIFLWTAFLVDPEPAHIFVFCVANDSAKYHVANFAPADKSSKRPKDDVSAVAIALKSRSVLEGVRYRDETAIVATIRDALLDLQRLWVVCVCPQASQVFEPDSRFIIGALVASNF